MYMNDTLRGRVALITGSGSGIGLEIATIYVRLGASVMLTGRNEAGCGKCRCLPRLGFRYLCHRRKFDRRWWPVVEIRGRVTSLPGNLPHSDDNRYRAVRAPHHLQIL